MSMAHPSGPRKRLGVARLWYEGNAFAPSPQRARTFERREWRKGPDALQAAQGTATELAAVCDFMQARPDWEVWFPAARPPCPPGR